jgi:hypothetical protein
MPGKRVQIDPETWPSVVLLSKDRMMSFQELFDEAIRDLLKKHNRPQSLKEALSKSVTRHERTSRAKHSSRTKRKRHRRAA